MSQDPDPERAAVEGRDAFNQADSSRAATIGDVKLGKRITEKTEVERLGEELLAVARAYRDKPGPTNHKAVIAAMDLYRDAKWRELYGDDVPMPAEPEQAKAEVVEIGSKKKAS